MKPSAEGFAQASTCSYHQRAPSSCTPRRTRPRTRPQAPHRSRRPQQECDASSRCWRRVASRRLLACRCGFWAGGMGGGKGAAAGRHVESISLGGDGGRRGGRVWPSGRMRGQSKARQGKARQGKARGSAVEQCVVLWQDASFDISISAWDRQDGSCA